MFGTRSGSSRPFLLSPSMGLGLNEVSSAILNSVAPSTWKSYQSAWHLWTSFFLTKSLPVFSFSERDILEFLDNLLGIQFSYSHVLKTLADISFFAKLNGGHSCL